MSTYFDYCSIVGKLLYMAQITKLDIMFSTQLIAKYLTDPCKEHGETVLHLVKYLKLTKTFGLKFKPDPDKLSWESPKCKLLKI